MARFTDFQDWLRTVRPEHRSLVEALRGLVLDVEPRFQEYIDPWGAPVFSLDGVARIYLMDFSRHVNLGLYNGSLMPDPEGIMEGTGKRLRHIKVRPEGPPAEVLRRYIRLSADTPPDANA